MNKVLITSVAALICAFAATAIAQAERYPDRSINLILPVAVGSSGDVAFRILGEKMRARLGQAFVNDNITGAAGLLGLEKARNAAPDGYTLLAGNDSSLIYLPLLNANAKFDPFKSFEPITRIADVEWVLIANPASGISTVADLVRLAKASPGKLNYASGGVASPQQIVMELFKKQAGIDLIHVPYKGTTPAMTDVMAGVVPVMFSGLGVANPLIESGKLKALAVPSLTRSKVLPNVPTLTELGYSGFEYRSWLAFLAPANTPAPRVDAIHAAAVLALRDPAVREELANRGMTPVGNTPAELKKNIADDYQRLSALVQALGLQKQ